MNTQSFIAEDDFEGTQVLSAFAQEIERIRRQATIDRAAGEPALRRLVELCESRTSGQVRRIAGFLAALFNGEDYPYDLTSLRSLDLDLQLDCLRVLKMDMNPEKEVHCYFINGNQRFNALFSKFGIAPVQPVRGKKRTENAKSLSLKRTAEGDLT
jgi:hypothetical protein